MRQESRYQNIISKIKLKISKLEESPPHSIPEISVLNANGNPALIEEQNPIAEYIVLK